MIGPSVPRFAVNAIGAFLFAATMACAGKQETASDPVDGDFSYKSKPIHPKLVYEFEPWISDDRPPVTVEVNVSAAFDTNEYFNEDVTVTETDVVEVPVSGDVVFGYKHLGSINDVHVVRTYSSSSGTGVFQSLQFICFSRNTAYKADGMEKERQLFMRIIRRITLGDRDTATIELTSDSVIVGSSKYREKPLTVEVDRCR